MKKIAIVVALFLFFLGVIDYPFISQIYNDAVAGRVVTQYDAGVKRMSQIQKEEAWQAAEKYNARLANGSVTLSDAFSEERKETSEEYLALLNIDKNGVMAVLDIPKINITVPVYHGTGEDVLQKGAGHLEGSSLPIGSESTHAVISAHRGLATKELFTSLDLLEPGDVFTIRVLGQTLTYEVFQVETVLPDKTESLNIVPGEDLVTLMTCTPYGLNTHRLLVHARRVPDEDVSLIDTIIDAVEGQSLESFLRQYGWIFVNVLLLAWLAFLVRVMWKREKEKSEKTEKEQNGKHSDI